MSHERHVGSAVQRQALQLFQRQPAQLFQRQPVQLFQRMFEQLLFVAIDMYVQLRL